MRMNQYNLNHLLVMLQKCGVDSVHMSFTETSGDNCGVLLCFEMPRS
jgi:hypothetical protein